MKYVHIASVSSGKDSQATMLLMIDRVGLENCRFVFADTGNEDDAVFQHLSYLESKLGIKIVKLMADFSERIAAKRMFISRDRRHQRRYKKVQRKDSDGNLMWRRNQDGTDCLVPLYDDDGALVSFAKIPIMGKDSGTKLRWTNKAKRRALSVLKPSGNPYLDLCLWKGRFPSRKAQFCTAELKTELLVEYQMAYVDKGYGVVSWQGVRRDESANRRNAKLFERVGPRLYQFRPIVAWTAQQTIDYSMNKGVSVNRLYAEGFDRVGCMPCINCGKKEVKNIALRRPGEIDRLAEWERLVALASKRGEASFFPDPDRDAHLDKRGIHKVVRWAKTTYGGRQFDLIPETNPESCSSSYGLCE